MCIRHAIYVQSNIGLIITFHSHGTVKAYASAAIPAKEFFQRSLLRVTWILHLLAEHD